MRNSSANRVPLIALLAAGAMLISVTVTACGDNGGGDTTETPTVAPTTAIGGEVGDGSGNGDGGGTAGGFGTATVVVSAGTYELQLEEPCQITEIGIGVIASSDDASFMIAGPQEIAVVTLELSPEELWSAVAADVVIEGTTMSYSGPALVPPGEDPTMSVQVACDEVTGLGG